MKRMIIILAAITIIFVIITNSVKVETNTNTGLMKTLIEHRELIENF